MTDASDSTQPDHLPALSNFREWMRDTGNRTKCYTVTDGVRTYSHEYISTTNIKKYLTSARIRSILNELFPQVPIRHDAVEKRCLVGFCILLSIQRGEYVRELLSNPDLRDTSLPFSGPPAHLPQIVWEEFLQAQWLFKPANLTPDRTKYQKDTRLPYLEKELIGKGASARLYKVTVDSDYDVELRGSQHASDRVAPTSPQVYALKVYKTQYALEDYLTETNNFERLCQFESGSKSPPGLIGYFGAYEQGDTFNILLEYGEGGSLHDYLDREDPPATGEAVHEFWSRILELLKALSRLHDLEDRTADHSLGIGQRYQGYRTHNDIRPHNIVLVREQTDQEGNDFHYTFKLADLGHGQFVKRGHESREIYVLDSHTGRSYASPESYRADEFNSRSRLRVTPKADIFSLGCVFLTVAVWIVYGPRGLREFHQARLKENEQGIGDTDYRFHNAHLTTPDLLEAARDRIESLPKDMRSSDHITGPVLDKLINPMLRTDQDDRPTARVLRATMFEVLKSAQYDSTMDRHRLPWFPSDTVDLKRQARPIQSTGGSSSSVSRRPVDAATLAQSLDPDPRLTMVEAPLPAWRMLTVNYPGSVSTGVSTDISAAWSSVSMPQSSRSSITELPQSPVSMPQYSRSGITEPPQSSRSGISQPMVAGQPRPRYLSAIPSVTHLDVLHWKRGRKSLMGRISRLFTSGLPSEEYHKRWLRQRNHVFLVDDSHSMGRHWSHVKDTFEALSYIVKECDPDGIDVKFTCSKTSHHGRTTKNLVNNLNEHRTSSGGSNIQRPLSDILRHIWEALEKAANNKSGMLPRPVSIYILTDGVWAENGDARSPILKTIQALKRYRLPRTAIGISLISFGDNQEALQRLRQLDYLGQSEGLSLDIVDTEPFDGNVWKMLIGGIDDYFDGDEPYEHAIGSNSQSAFSSGSQRAVESRTAPKDHPGQGRRDSDGSDTNIQLDKEPANADESKYPRILNQADVIAPTMQASPLGSTMFNIQQNEHSAADHEKRFVCVQSYSSNSRHNASLAELLDKCITQCRTAIEQAQGTVISLRPYWVRSMLVDFNHWAAGVQVFDSPRKNCETWHRLPSETLVLIDRILHQLTFLFERLPMISRRQAHASGTDVESTDVESKRSTTENDALVPLGRPVSFDSWSSENSLSALSSEDDMHSGLEEQELAAADQELPVTALCVDAGNLLERLFETVAAIRNHSVPSHLSEADASFSASERHYWPYRKHLEFLLQLKNGDVLEPPRDQKSWHSDFESARKPPLRPEQILQIEANMRRLHRFICAHRAIVSSRLWPAASTSLAEEHEVADPAEENEPDIPHSSPVPANVPSSIFSSAQDLEIPDPEAYTAPSAHISSTAGDILYPEAPLAGQRETFKCPCCARLVSRQLGIDHKSWKSVAHIPRLVPLCLSHSGMQLDHNAVRR